jgi:RNA polymerase sigma-70 factor, ECF subfamily
MTPEELEQTRSLADELLGSGSSLGEELPRVYEELRAVASNFLRSERPNHTLQPTALVHEAYLRLVDQRKVNWANKPQFMAIAARMMRRILLNHAVSRGRTKRGSGAPLVSLDAALEVLDEQALSALELNRALQELEALDRRQAHIVEMRFFGGMSVDETAEVLGISAATVKREWAVAKLWLEREMSNAVAS